MYTVAWLQQRSAVCCWVLSGVADATRTGRDRPPRWRSRRSRISVCNYRRV